MPGTTPRPLRLPARLGCAVVLAAAAGCAETEPDATGAPEPAQAGADREHAGAGSDRASPPWLVDVTAGSGMDFTHETGATGRLLLPEIMASGGALFDADGDGDLDVYLTNGAWSDARADPPPRNRLYIQVAPWTFEDATDSSGAGDTGYGMGVAVGDYDGDGRPDLYVCNDGRDRLLRNLGGGSFEDVTDAAGVAVDGWSSSAAFVDHDADGDLDLFVTRYVAFDPSRQCSDGSGRSDYCGPKSFPPLTDVLLRNDGLGGFTDVSVEAGITAHAGPGLGVACADLDRDGRVDIFVANDGAANHLWHNRGDGTFEEQALLAGCAFNLHGQPEAGMGIACEDVDGDGLRDLFLTHQARETNTLYRGRPGGFTDATGTLGLGATSLPFTGFGTVVTDLDCDGRMELLAVGGRVLRGDARDDARDEARHETSAAGAMPIRAEPPWDRYAEPNLLYRWDDGAFALDAVAAPDFTAPHEVSRGLAAGDIDGDGDLDLLLTNAHGPARLYRNDAARQGHWLLVRTVLPSGADAIGAVVRVELPGIGGAARVIERDVISTSSYQSASAPAAHIGLGAAERVDAIEVRWPDGSRERFPGGVADRIVQLHRGAGDDA